MIDRSRQAMRRVMLPEVLDEQIAQAKRDLLATAREPGELTLENKGAVVRLLTLLARAGQIRPGEAGAFIPRDMVQALVSLYVERDPDIDPEYAAEQTEREVVEALIRLDFIDNRADMLATSEEKRKALRVYADSIYRWTGRSWGPEEELLDQGSLAYGDLHPRGPDEAVETDLVMPNYMVGSDYSGGSVERANYRAFLEDYEDVEGVFPVYGGHDTYGVAIQIAVEDDEMWEHLAQLEDYPLYSEEAHSEFEMEAAQQAWESWGAGEFRTELEKKFEGYEFDEVSDDNLAQFFEEMRERANEYWEAETGGAMYIRIERVVAVVETRDIIELEGVTFPEEGVEVPAGAGPRTTSR